MTETFTLDKAPLQEPLEVVAVNAEGVPEDWRDWLEEIGFSQGEPCEVMHRAALGGDPIAVRIGVSTFALRLAEASCIQVKRKAD
jgi:ferrous iron transport protein A